MLLEAVPRGKPAERLVRGHDLVALAIRETRLVLLVEGGKLIRVPLRVRGVGRRPLGIDTRERRRDIGDDLSHQLRVEPHVRIERLRATVLDGLVARVDRQFVEHEQRPVGVPALGDVFQRGLEVVPHRDDEVGVLEVVDLPGGQLEVVRLGAGGSEIVDPDIVAADLPDRLGERIEGRHDLNAPARSVRIIVTAARGQSDERAQDECEPTRLEQGPAPHNENDSYSAPTPAASRAQSDHLMSRTRAFWALGWGGWARLR